MEFFYNVKFVFFEAVSLLQRLHIPFAFLERW
jgi:hypothetical protein